MELKKAQDRLHVTVFSPFQTFYKGDATSISAINKTGPFDVLYDHANFFSLLTAGEVKVATGFQDYDFLISRGVIKVTDNVVTVFVDV